MDKFVTITKTKENIITFDISVQGVATTDIRVWFSIKAGQIEVNVPCVKLDGDKWEATIPPLPFIEITAYPCSVCMVADGYYFEPMNGTVDVVGSAQIYTSQSAQNVSFAPSVQGPASNVSDKGSDVQTTKSNSPAPEYTTAREATTKTPSPFQAAKFDFKRTRVDEKPTLVDDNDEKQPTNESRTVEQIAADLLNETPIRVASNHEAPKALEEKTSAVVSGDMGVDPTKQKVDDILGALGIEVPEPIRRARFTIKK